MYRHQPNTSYQHPPGSYFEAFFADDGQRSLRYAPFYANSGFYYLLANERSVYFTWSIMISFDLIQARKTSHTLLHAIHFDATFTHSFCSSHPNLNLFSSPPLTLSPFLSSCFLYFTGVWKSSERIHL